MIENICSNMAGKEKEYPVSGRKPPKNVRQIGTFTGDFRIYVEDYVHTFTHWLAEQEHTECVAVMVGEFARSEHAREVYAYGTVTAKQACANGKIEMNAQVWTQVYETIKHYFPDGEIVGWFCGGTSFTAEEKEEIFKIHLDHFAGADRILLLYDFLDQEEEFYRYEDGEMKCQGGYYIYYEKNTEMQNYMIEQKQGKGNEENVDDRAVREVRARWNAEKKAETDGEGEKKEENVQKKGGGRFFYSVGIVMSAVALIAAASMLYNQERLKGFEQTLNKLLGGGEEKEPDAKEASSGKTEGKQEKDNSEKNETMAWEITASVAPEKKGESESDNLDGQQEKEGEDKDSEGNSSKDKQTEQGGGKENDGKTGMDSSDDEQIGSELSDERTEQGDDKESDGKGGSTQTGADSDKGEQTDKELSDGSTEQGDHSESSGRTEGEDKENQSEDEQGEQGENNQTEGEIHISEGEDNENPGSTSEETTPKPGDAVQTGEIGGPGVAVDTSKMQIYTVKSGDTLVGICRKFYGNLSQLEYIKELNQINNENLIYVDQELVLP